MQRVVLIGGGSGATMLSHKLPRKGFEVVMLTASLDHLFQPALLYIAFQNARANVTRDERHLVGGGTQLIEERVTAVDLPAQTVTGSSGSSYPYDFVVVATGVQTDPGQIPGLEDVTSNFGDYHSTISQAQKLWGSLDRFQGGTIAVGQSTPICKCPPSPVEGVLLVDRLLRQRGLRDKTRLIFFTPYTRPYPAEPMNEVIEPILKAREVEVMTMFDVDHIDPAKRLIVSIEGDHIDYDLPIIIPPFMGAEIAYRPASILDPSRFVIADKASLRIEGFPNAFAIGDANNLPTSKAGVGAHLEANLVARALRGKRVAFNGRTNCPVDLGNGRGTFVIGSYTAPVVKYPASRLNLLMKMVMERIYWISLRGAMEPIFDVYFKLTDPDRLARRHRPS
ncbi:MAG: NAD(P)/FAD-dependent oxidoreductase [Candidatus Dormibacteria bacterium]